ncbi:hypothetical protein C0J08_15035 [Marinomonas sp. CT5]|uniref:hypothetical protein n=1 Tax=Marinomonas sp. CT5 TaxID=2066133 RepID=UPI001BAE8F1F|nr:hypothetical protein [Marinomonas sp. CT5]QUX96634.1 hypothetical protein C0J08_15035 [Marinomonas sp. CT5]
MAKLTKDQKRKKQQELKKKQSITKAQTVNKVRNQMKSFNIPTIDFFSSEDDEPLPLQPSEEAMELKPIKGNVYDSSRDENIKFYVYNVIELDSKIVKTYSVEVIDYKYKDDMSAVGDELYPDEWVSFYKDCDLRLIGNEPVLE